MSIPALVVSPNIMNIYYADMFIINGKGTLVMGHGKSDCSWKASNMAPKSRVGEDFIGLTTLGNDLYGSLEQFMVSPGYKSYPHKIEVWLYCMSEEDTKNNFRTDPPTVLFGDVEKLFQVCRFNISYTGEHIHPLMQEFMNQMDYKQFVSEDARGHRFINLVGHFKEKVKCVLVPWMPTADDRVALIRKYV
jgi:hypothetical protein